MGQSETRKSLLETDQVGERLERAADGLLPGPLKSGTTRPATCGSNIVQIAIRISLLPFTVSLALAGGCVSGDDGETSAPAVRDSSGSTIVESRAARWPKGAGWRLAERPVVDIGAAQDDPAHQLYLVTDARRLADGRIVVANSGSREMRFYDGRGQHLKSVGGEGQGPGKFEYLIWIATLPGDSLVTWDRGHRRLSIFDPNGRFIRSFTLDQPEGAAGPPEALDVFADGSVLARAGIAFGAPVRLEPGLIRRPFHLFRFHPPDGRVQEIGRFPGLEYFFDGTGFTLRAFARWVLVAVADSGFYLGTSERYEIRHYAGDGALKRVIRTPRPNRAVTADDRKRFIDASLAEIRDANWRERTRRAYDEMPFPETMPAYSDLLPDAEGNLWVEDYHLPGGGPGRWTVFDREGFLLGSVEVPARFSVFQVGRDFVLGRAADDRGVEYVRLYPLLKE